MTWPINRLKNTNALVVLSFPWLIVKAVHQGLMMTTTGIMMSPLNRFHFPVSLLQNFYERDPNFIVNN